MKATWNTLMGITKGRAQVEADRDWFEPVEGDEIDAVVNWQIAQGIARGEA